MKYQFDGYNYLVRLDKGELLIENLKKLAVAENIKGGWISLIGGALWAELGFYQLETQEYEWRKFDQILEITSAQGTLAWSGGEPMIHLHGNFSDEEFKTYGGHVKEAAISGTGEIFVHVWNKEQLQKSTDEKVGLQVLDL